MASDLDALHAADLCRDRLVAKWKRQARAAARSKRCRNLYVITLHPDVLDHEEFRHANPGYRYGMPCVYVGMTIHQPGDRFLQHKSGYRSSKFARRYGVELALELMDGFDASQLPEQERERALAEWLQAQGFAVWQN